MIRRPSAGMDQKTSSLRARAPMCLNLGGRGSDLPSYADQFGGCCLGLAVSLYAYANLEWRSDRKVGFTSPASRWECPLGASMDWSGSLGLHKAVYQRILQEFTRGDPLALTLTTWSDTHADSGLAGASALVVAMIEVFNGALKLGLGQHDIAKLAYEIERIEVGDDGGQHDHYAVAFGGCNFMEFYQDRIAINPLRLHHEIRRELESGLILFETKPSRDVPAIIAQQCELIAAGDHATLQALHQLKQEAGLIKEALLRADMQHFGTLLADSWSARLEAAEGVSNAYLDRIIKLGLDTGARAAQVTGTGGGGFLLFLADPLQYTSVVQALAKEPNGRIVPCRLTDQGVESWCAAV